MVERVVLVFRMALGGLFRHVCDVGVGLSQRGYKVGVICGDHDLPPYWQNMLDNLISHCELGSVKMPISRGVSPLDLSMLPNVLNYINDHKPHVLHGHGAKGGYIARLAGSVVSGPRPARIYTPHGGSLQIDHKTFEGRFYHMAERILYPLADGLIFESSYALERYKICVTTPKNDHRIIYNGLAEEEFAVMDRTNVPYDFLYMAEFHPRKGYDIFVDALQILLAEGHTFKVLCAGSGVSEADFKARVEAAGLQDSIDFSPPLRASDAFARAKCYVSVSRFESMPYAILEAAACEMPIISTEVGGIPEIFKDGRLGLCKNGDLDALLMNLRGFIVNPDAYVEAARQRRIFVQRHFNMDAMLESIMTMYEDAFERRNAG